MHTRKKLHLLIVIFIKFKKDTFYVEYENLSKNSI